MSVNGNGNGNGGGAGGGLGVAGFAAGGGSRVMAGGADQRAGQAQAQARGAAKIKAYENMTSEEQAAVQAAGRGPNATHIQHQHRANDAAVQAQARHARNMQGGPGGQGYGVTGGPPSPRSRPRVCDPETHGSMMYLSQHVPRSQIPAVRMPKDFAVGAGGNGAGVHYPTARAGGEDGEASSPASDGGGGEDGAPGSGRSGDAHGGSDAASQPRQQPGYTGSGSSRRGSVKLEGGLSQHYHLGEKLDSGAFASVRVGWKRRPAGEGAAAGYGKMPAADRAERVAVKTYDKAAIKASGDAGSLRHLEQEVALVGRLDHPNVACAHTMFETAREVHLVMEFAEGGSLAKHCRGLRRGGSAHLAGPSVKEAKRLFRQVGQGVAYMHAMGLCHRDLKLENAVITTGGVVKLIDYGLGARTGSKQCSTVCGSPEYMAPELCNAIDHRGQAKHTQYSGAPVDVWSLGVMLFVLLTGKFPFSASTAEGIFRNVRRGQFEVPASVPAAARALILAMLHPDPEQRPTVPALLANEWMLAL
jgi:hypothetical protein